MPLILAAGAGSRFGGGKLAARIDGMPVLAHVIAAVRSAGFPGPVVVVGPDDPPGVDLAGTVVVRNPAPERGISSSLRIGWARALGGTRRDVALPDAPARDAPGPDAAAPDAPAPDAAAPDAVLVMLADQPLVGSGAIVALASLPLDQNRPIAVARYRGAAARNPVRIERTAAALVDEVDGDRGLGPLIDAHPELVRWIDVAGDNPDIDTAEDLADVADLAWATRVRGNREQVDRLREEPDGPDFYASVSSIFREDPDRESDPVLDAVRAHARASDTWLDIGAGAGRYALPLARAVRRVIAVDPSRSMLEGLRDGMSEHGIENIDVFEGRWPDASAEGSHLAGRLPVDVSLIAHVGYDIDEMWPFLEGMERATTRECLAILMERSPAAVAEPFWPEIHGERRISLPALPAFVDLLAAHGRRPTVQRLQSSRRCWASREEVESFVRRQTWVKPGSAKDWRMQSLLDEWLVQAEDGSWELLVAEPLEVGLVAWQPVPVAG